MQSMLDISGKTVQFAFSQDVNQYVPAKWLAFSTDPHLQNFKINLFYILTIKRNNCTSFCSSFIIQKQNSEVKISCANPFWNIDALSIFTWEVKKLWQSRQSRPGCWSTKEQVSQGRVIIHTIVNSIGSRMQGQQNERNNVDDSIRKFRMQSPCNVQICLSIICV